MAKNRRKARKQKKQAKEGFKNFLIVLVVLLVIFSAFIMVNERWLHIEQIPTTAEIFEVMGFDKRPEVHVEQDEISVHFIDVGQGDCILIDTPEKDMLIDCGEEEYSSDVIRYLNAFGITRLDYVMVTHQHADHMGGMSKILSSLDIGQVIMPEVPSDMLPTPDYYTDTISLIESSGILSTKAVIGDKITLCEGTALEIIGPIGTGYPDLNSYSIVSMLVSGNRRFLFTGDIESDAEKNLIAALIDISADVIKVPHHGSSSSSSSIFVKRVNPEFAVVTVGIDNTYNHPDNRVIGRYYGIKSEVLMTMYCGDIVFVTDGNELSYVTTSGESGEAA